MTARRHDPERSVLRCSRADLLAVASGRVADGLVLGDQLLAASMTVREPTVRWAVLRDGTTIDAAVGPQLTVALPATDPDDVVDVALSATASLARTLHRALDPPVRVPTWTGTTTHARWDDAVASLDGDELRQLRWSDGVLVPTAAALVVAIGDGRCRRLRRQDDAVLVESVTPAQLWSACCVLAARADRLARAVASA